MTDILVRDLDAQTKAQLQARAKRNGRSVSAEARSLLRAGVAAPEPKEGLGTQIAKRFAEAGFTDDEHRDLEVSLRELRNRPRRPPPDFSE